MRYLIVDGHSMIFAWPELRALHSRRAAVARGELVRRLTQYQDATGVRVVAVFDGRGVKQSEDSEPGGIQVFYSKSGQTADSIVERLCARYGGEHELMVATDDNMERQTALSFGASTLSSEMLLAMLGEAGADLHRRLRPHRRR
ncbi:MAG: NYN domain-containing protein [Chthoniobacteraceae bacterium]